MLPVGMSAITSFKIMVPLSELTKNESTGSTPSNDDSGDRQQQTQAMMTVTGSSKPSNDDITCSKPSNDDIDLQHPTQAMMTAPAAEKQPYEETQQPYEETQQPYEETQQPNETQQPYEETQQAEYPCEETQQEETQVEPNETQQRDAIDLEIDTQSYTNMLRWGSEYDAIAERQQVYILR